LFVEEAQDTWEVDKLGNVAVVQNGYSFSSSEYVPFQEGHLEVLKMGHIAASGGLRTNPKKDFVPRTEKLKRWILRKDDIIMAMTDMKDNVVILGVPAMIDKSDKYVLNQRVARIYLESNTKLLNSHLLYIQLNNSEFIATLQSKANSGVQVNLSTEAIKDCDIIIPPIELQREKGTLITELYLKKENNEVQIKILTQLRNTLLPKLMRGEVRVKIN
jgi:type I restriction enzyme S subunit